MASRKQINDQMSVLRQLISREPRGLAIDEIGAGSGLALDLRTLQRRLEALLSSGQIRSLGQGRATRYVQIADTPSKSQAAPAAIDELPLIVYSPAGAEILRLVSRPLAARKPVAYNRKFLDSYHPNKSRYLTTAETRRLREISKTSGAADLPAGTYAQRILGRLLIDLSWNSSRLEGNTYSLLDTQRLIEAGELADNKMSTEAQMILNHKAAIEFLVQSADEIGFDRYTILNLHGLLAENLLPDPAAAGRLRAIPVAIGKSVYHPPEIPHLVEECFDQILDTAAAIDDPFEQAFFVMVQLPYQQPFEDVNKRVSRLAANIPLIRRNLSPLSFVDVTVDAYTHGILGVYELNRVDLLKDLFVWACGRSAARYAAIRQTIGEPDPFRLRHRLALKQVVGEVIRSPMRQKAAARHIAAWARDNIAAPDRARFVEVAETELMGLHEGNFARFQVRPREYEAWRKVWST
jgi:fido (protein-threonine AMPylation protein)